MKTEKTKQPDELFTDKRRKLKDETKVYTDYSKAKIQADSRRSYVCHCYDESGNLFGFFVAN